MLQWKSNFGTAFGIELNFKSHWEDIYKKTDQKLCPPKIIKLINLTKKQRIFS